MGKQGTIIIASCKYQSDTIRGDDDDGDDDKIIVFVNIIKIFQTATKTTNYFFDLDIVLTEIAGHEEIPMWILIECQHNWLLVVHQFDLCAFEVNRRCAISMKEMCKQREAKKEPNRNA